MEKTHLKNNLQKLFFSSKRVLALLLIAILCQLYLPNLYSQTNKTISLNEKQIPLSKLFTKIEKEAGYLFFYVDADIKDLKVDIEVNNQTIDQILLFVLRNTGLTYKISGRNVNIVKQTSTQVTKKKNITGKILDNEGEPIIGANVAIKEENTGTISDFDGNFSISGVTDENTLVFSFMGYVTQELKVGKQTVMNVRLLEDTQALEEVVVVGYGTQKKASVVGSVQSIVPKELSVPASNLSTSFAGRLAGVIAVQRSGQPGNDGSDFYIRGISTMSGITRPLIILDGVEVSSADLNSLDSEVIESFSILKDATATALYGTRGANGVMIVTTKSGANLDKPKIHIRLEGRMSQNTSKPNLVDGVTYMELYNEGVKNLGSGVLPFSEERIQGTRDGVDPYLFPSVNWYDEMFNNHSFSERFNMNIRGGGTKVTYFMNINVDHASGAVRPRSKEFFSFNNNIDVKKYVFQSNLDARLSKNTNLSLRINAQMTNSAAPKMGTQSLFSYAISTNPVDFPVYYPREEEDLDHVKWGAYKGGSIPPYNPMAELVSGNSTSFSSMIVSNLTLKHKFDYLLTGLSFSGLASFKNYSSTHVSRQAPYNMYLVQSFSQEDGEYIYKPEPTGEVKNVVLNTSGSTGGDRRVYLQAMLNYDRIFIEKHDVNLMFLYNQDEFLYNVPGNSLINSLPKRKQGFAGRLAYAYDRKYLAEVNMGLNGSENFAPGERWGFFPSFAFGYNVSEENYFSSLKDIISHLKLRASWGLVGNDQTGAGRFVYMEDVSLYGRGYTTGIDQNTSLSGPKYNRYANNKLTWEVGEKVNFGVDFNLFRAVNITFDIFREHRTNIFQSRQSIPKYFGLAGTQIFANIGEVKNSGFDLSVDYSKSFNKEFQVSFKGTVSFAKNKIIKYDEVLKKEYPQRSSIGKPINSIWGYIAEGYYATQEEVDNYAEVTIDKNIAPGDIKYRDLPNAFGETDGRIDANDRQAMGYPTVPQIVYGFGPNVKYKNWDLGLFFQGVSRTSFMMSNFHPFGSNSRRNVLKWVADSHWTTDNPDPNAAYPRLTKDDHPNNSVSSSMWLRNGSFIKLKNAEIGYSYKNMRVYVSGLNLLTFSNFKLWDPEQGGSNGGFSYPTQRVFNAGIQISIN